MWLAIYEAFALWEPPLYGGHHQNCPEFTQEKYGPVFDSIEVWLGMILTYPARASNYSNNIRDILNFGDAHACDS